MAIDIAIRLSECAEAVDKKLSALLSEEKTVHPVLSDAMRYTSLSGGKRIRSFLTVSIAKMFGASEEKSIPFACAVEMVHAYSLIHDDLPAMDNSPLRRGVPSCHVKFGEAMALLAGDALLTRAFGVLSENRSVSDRSVSLAVSALSRLAGQTGMCGGQAIDLSDEVDSLDDLFELYYLKTGALIEASCLLGYYAACDEPSLRVEEDIGKYARSLGIAFQIHDDILDATGDSSVLGKPTGLDLKNDKKNVLYFLNIEEAEKLEYDFTLSSIGAISDYPDSEGPCQLPVWLMSRRK